MSGLEKWTESQLEELGVDHVFAPYICGMLIDNADTLRPEEVRGSSE